jgi:aryl-alcohol dehydrogenase-like predicted oxidoreductase
VPADSRFSQQVEFIQSFKKGMGQEKWDSLVATIAKLEPIAERLGVKMSALALAWVLKNPNVSSAIMGASSPQQVYDNVRSLEVVGKLTPEILKEIDEVLGNKPAELTLRF